MENKNQFEQLHAEILSEIRNNGACVGGYSEVIRSGSINEISKSIKKWWNEVLGMHLESSLHLFSDFFFKFKDEFNANGIYFNQDASEGYVIIYDAKVCLSGSAQGRAFGHSEVDACGQSSLIAFGDTKVNARDSAKVELKDQSSGVMYNQSEVKAYDKSSVLCEGGKALYMADQSTADVRRCGSIHAYGEAYVKNINPRMERRIYLYEQSTTKLNERDER